MFRLTQKIFAIFSEDDKLHLAGVFAVAIVAAIIEVMGISAVMPFIGVLADPHLADRHPILLVVKHLPFAQTQNGFAITLGAFAIISLVFGNLFLAYANWHLMRFTYGLAHTISYRMLRRYLARDFEYFQSKNTATIKKNILDEVSQVVGSVIVPYMQALSKIPLVVIILIVLLVIDPLIAVSMAVILGGAYMLVFGAMRHYLNRIGTERMAKNEIRFRAAQEVLDGLVEIKLLGKEGFYRQRFEHASKNVAEMLAMSMTLAMTPRYILEIIAFGGILMIAVLMLVMRGTVGQSLPLIGIYVVAGYRLMPALQIVFTGITKARFAESTLEMLRDEIGEEPDEAAVPAAACTRLVVERDIQLEHVFFTFRGSDRTVLSDISLTIPANRVAGIAGSTGAGKTTVAGLLLGLLEPSAGRILIDGQPLTRENVRCWQQNIGYVSQRFFIADASVRQNIALGLLSQEIDDQAVEKAARAANIHDFIASLPKGYETVIGEHGTKLSGGQRQRLAIARALYHDPGLLVFDEATSALDTETETEVMAAIDRLASRKTIILIAHRINTLAKASTIYVLKQGRVAGYGTLDELIRQKLLAPAPTTSRSNKNAFQADPAQ